MSIPEAERTVVPVVDAYTHWAKTYDTDGNFLQKVDDELVTEVLALPSFLGSPASPPKRIVDLGCGTGRNTVKLLAYPGVEKVLGLDVTQSMLDVAKTRPELAQGIQDGRLVLGIWDLLNTDPAPAIDDADGGVAADAIISTLVLEHLPSLSTFFHRARTLLRKDPGAWIFVTNMHPTLGVATGANFVSDTGERRWTEKFVWSAEDVVSAARETGFKVMEGVGDDGKGVWTRTVRDEAHGGPKAGKWIGKEVLFAVALVAQV
ncbi:Methyltransf-25 domain-containing protein [Mycena kentingensis (nom. inval.)]|nr:Methyltransf-25 domain-containing protein [Mycena kentingensis (nom. inval.)]